MSEVLAIPAEPLISVVMPVRNGAPYVADAVSSIQAQSYRHWELVVVDNESDDDSAAIVGALAARDSRIRLITGVPRGIAGALNAGVDLARGQLIARMDADDVAVPERLEVQLQWMRRTGVEICGGWIQQFGDRQGLVWFPETHEAIARELLFRCALMHPTVLTHAEILVWGMAGRRWRRTGGLRWVPPSGYARSLTGVSRSWWTLRLTSASASTHRA